MASRPTYKQPKRSKTALSWPLSPPRTPALHRDDGAINPFMLTVVKKGHLL